MPEKKLSEKDHRERLQELREKTHKQVDYHMRKAYVDESDFYHLVTGFFLELLERKYEPTYEELLSDLETLEHEFMRFSPEQREQARQLLAQLSHHSYRPGQVDQESAKQMLEQFRQVASALTGSSDGSIDQMLHHGFLHLDKGNQKAALAAYQKARKKYDELPAEQQARYHPQLSKLYAKLSA